MTSRTVGTGITMLLYGAYAYSQICQPDPLRRDTALKYHEFRLEIPVGQTFISNNWGRSCTVVKTHVPDGAGKPTIDHDTVGRRVVSSVSLGGGQVSHQTGTTVNSDAGSGSYVEFSMSAAGNPEDYIVQVNPDPSRPASLNLNLGYGMARLDLSDLSIDGISIVSGAADVILTYNHPNRMEMRRLNIHGGMSTVTLRNIEKSRAGQVDVENSMGETVIFLSGMPDTVMVFNLKVGAGSASLMAPENTPIKLVFSDNMFSSVELPEGMIPTEKNVYINLPYKADASKAVTVYIDLSIGGFSLMTYRP